MSLKILLTADIHLGLKFASYGEKQKELSEARFETLKKVIEIGNDENIDILVIAGDLFDRLNVADRDIVNAAQILSQFQGKLVAVLPGNHDFITKNDSKLWNKFKKNTGDRVLVLEDTRVYLLNHYDLDINLYSCPCNSKHSEVNNTTWIKDENKDSSVKYHIGVAHGSLLGVSPDPESKYFPMSGPELLSYGLDVWLLGHTDRLQYPSKADKYSRIFYPGTHEPKGFECNNKGNVWLLTIDEEKNIHADSFQVGKYYFAHESKIINDEDDLKKIIDDYSNDNMKNCLMKLEINGRLPKNTFCFLKTLQSELDRLFFYIEIDSDNIKQNITKEIINKEFTTGSFPYQLLSKLIQDPDRQEELEIAYDLIEEIKK